MFSARERHKRLSDPLAIYNRITHQAQYILVSDISTWYQYAVYNWYISGQEAADDMLHPVTVMPWR